MAISLSATSISLPPKPSLRELFELRHVKLIKYQTRASKTL